MLLDIPGGNYATLTGTQTWGDGLVCAGDNYALTNDTVISQWAGDITISAWVKSTATNAIIFTNTDNFSWGSYLGILSGKARLSCIIGGAQKSMDSAAAVNDGLWHYLCGVYNSVTGYMYIYVDGHLAQTPATYAGALRTVGADKSVLLAFYDQTYDFTGNCRLITYDQKPLVANQVSSLSADPLLPFRRKTSVSLYVPSGETPVFKPHWARYCNNLIGVA